MRTIPAIIEHNASFQQGAPVSAVDLLSDYEPATEVPTILANCGQQRDVLRPLRVRAVRAASLSRRNIKVGCGSWLREMQTCCDAVEWCSQGSDVHRLSREVRLSALTEPRCRNLDNSEILALLARASRITFHATHVSCREVIWWRVGIGFQRFLIRSRFHAPRVKGGHDVDALGPSPMRPLSPRADGFDAARKSFGVVPRPALSIREMMAGERHWRG
jgi:hypothetical protein